MTTGNIFGTFRLLTVSQLRQNARFVAVWVAPFILVACAVAASVITGIIWIAACAALIGIAALCLIAAHTKRGYTPRFGKRYNFLRFLIGGTTVYMGVAWRGLLGLHNRLYYSLGYEISAENYGWTVLMMSLTLLCISNLTLNRISDIRIADLLGFVEVLSALLASGAVMFLLLYT